MTKKTGETLVICIIALEDNVINEANIQAAKDLCPQVILFASPHNYFAQSISEKMKIRLITGNSITDYVAASEKLLSDWFLCIRANELIKFNSADAILRFIKNSEQQIYGVYSREYVSQDEYYDFSFIRNLGQYDNINEEAGVMKIEPRFIKKNNLNEIFNYLMENKDFTRPFSKIVHDLQIVPDTWQKEKIIEQKETDHDLLCLKGEKYYGSVADDNIDELNSYFVSFNVVNINYLNAFMEIAKRGWGTDKMFINMLDFLGNNGLFDNAKTLYDSWIKNRYGNESAYIYTMGGIIYANLLLLDKAVYFYEKAIKIIPTPPFLNVPAIVETLGKLNIILGNSNNAVNYLNTALDLKPSMITEQILSAIKKDGCRPHTLSACIVTNDDEKTVAKAITSLMNIADEIIIIDTGSQDNTVNIAGGYNSKIFSVPWNDNFSEVRNRAIEKASCDYILMMNANEYIDSRDRLGLLFTKSLLSPSNDYAYRVKVDNEEDCEAQAGSSTLKALLHKENMDFPIRLFPRTKGVNYSGFAFESVENSLIKSEIQISMIPFFKITKQNIEISLHNNRMENAVKKAAASLDNPNTAMDCALFYLKSGNLTAAMNCFNKTSNIDPLLATNIVNFFSSQNQLDEARKIAAKALTDNPDSFDLNMALATVHFKDESYEDIIDLLFPFIKEKTDKISEAQRGDFLLYMGIASLEKNLNEDAFEYIAQALETNLIDTRYQIAGLYAFAKSDNWEEFLVAASKIVNQERIDIDFEIKDFSDLGRLSVKLIQHFSQKSKYEETAILRKVIAYMVFANFINKEEIEGIVDIINENAGRNI